MGCFSENELDKKAPCPPCASSKKIKTAIPEELRREYALQRSRSMRLDADVVFASFCVQIAERMKDLLPHTNVQTVDRQDKLFKSGFVRKSRIHRCLVPAAAVRRILEVALTHGSLATMGTIDFTYAIIHKSLEKCRCARETHPQPKTLIHAYVLK
jgi:hypothetical protein